MLVEADAWWEERVRLRIGLIICNIGGAYLDVLLVLSEALRRVRSRIGRLLYGCGHLADFDWRRHDYDGWLLLGFGRLTLD